MELLRSMDSPSCLGCMDCILMHGLLASGCVRSQFGPAIPDPSQGLPWRNHTVWLLVKPANVLLDENMRAKIADFGISRWLSENQSSVISSKSSRTMGYLAPEFYMSRQISFNSDIYSLGVIIIETTVKFTREFITEKRLL